METKKLSERWHIDPDTGCKYRYISSETERFGLHRHDFYEVFITINRRITHIINGEIQVLPKGSLVLIRPDDIHSYVYEQGKNYNFVNLAFSTETMGDFLRFIDGSIDTDALLKSPQPPWVVLTPTDCKNLLTRLDEISCIYKSDKMKFKLLVRCFLLDLFVKYFADVGLLEKIDVPYWFESLCEQMEQQQNYHVGIERMEEICGKSREHIARCMKKYRGVTSTEFVNELRLNYVANMLISSNKSILDLCYDSGFKNVGWFYTLFKEKYGMPPNKFRESTNFKSK